jgi:KDO2-lipid IV(A) lauroyltransferase
VWELLVIPVSQVGADGGTGDLRTGGRWSLAQQAKNHLLCAIAYCAFAGARRLPVGVARALGRSLGLAAHALAVGARRTALANVRLALPNLEAPETLVRLCFATLGELLGETVASLGLEGQPPRLEVSKEAREVLAEALREGRGVVFPSAHIGPWEQVAASLVAAGVPLMTLARESYDPRLSKLYTELRRRNGVEVIWRARPSAGAQILRALRAGRVLGMPMDLRSRVASCDAKFLGHSAPTPVGPARIALRARAPVVVGTAAPASGQSGGWWVTATRLATEDLPSDEAGAVALTERINQELSRRILAAPHGWVWMHDRWPNKESSRNGSMIERGGEPS